jgi:hypothetical protein
MFDCKKYVPGGLRSSWDDNNGGCIWFDYIAKHNIPIDTIGDKTFGSQYETALREAFFKIAARYPSEVLKTFIYYKPQLIVRSIAQSLRINLVGDQAMVVNPAGAKAVPYPPTALALLLASLAAVLAYFSVEKVAMADLRRIGGVTLLSALFTIPAYIAAWAIPTTSADLLLYCLFSVGLALGAILIFARSALRSPTQIWGPATDK